ncbi:MAG: Glutamyl-tRNA(Gln) amidotransferase subunit [Pseudomonadota bacterium]|jgi:aspartyl-tRNA(Asn)/glutamyl-tRNA(Gln) amidotransferase subunit A
MSELHNKSVADLAAMLKNKEVSAVEVATRFLARMGGNPHNAFLDINSEVTLAQAQASDEKIAKGTAGPLEGVPIAHKDIFVTKDFATTAGSKILKDYRSPFDATVVSKLREAGMVTLGKLNCDEFAMGSANENSAYGAVTNPWDTTRIPGGSSGGSSAAVAARLTPAATGTDTGGSIRQPAAFCGITGIKPTYGRASRYGMVAFASSLDQAGPMARSAEDCALLLSAMCGPDLDRDSTSLNVPQTEGEKKFGFSHLLRIDHGNKPLAAAGRDGGPLKIGYPREWLGGGSQVEFDSNAPTRRSEGTDIEVQRRIEEALAHYKSLGAELVEVSLPQAQLSIPVYYIVCAAEASSNLSRFDGVKFGHRAKEFSDLADMYQRTRSEGFGDEVKRRIMIGSYVLSHGYYDAYYLQAQKIRRMIAQDFQQAFAQCDVITGPVAPTTAWKLGDKADDPVANYLADIFTLPASLAGLPCMSIPVGLGDMGMPVGMQLIGNYLQEAQLLNVAHRFQQFTEFHLVKPEGV